MRTAIGVLIVVLLLATIVPAHQDLVTYTDGYSNEFRAYYIPSSAYLKVVSLGQENFCSDLIFIWAVQFFDQYGAKVRDTYLYHTFDVITDLDPKFNEAYIFGNLFLSLDKRWDLLYELSDKGLAANGTNWMIAWDAGTYAFFQAKDYDRALRFFSIAYERNPKQPMLKDLLANAYKYRGDYETSLLYWRNILAENEESGTSQARFFKMAAERNIFDLTIKIDLRRLGKAIDAYRKRHGVWPLTLGALRTDGEIASIPVDPTGKPYSYNARNGRVSCTTPFKFKGKFAKW